MRQLTRDRAAAAAMEAALARLYTDPAARASFLADPESFSATAGLPAADASALAAIDRTGLRLAARSYAAKRRQAHRPSLLRRILQRFRFWIR